MVKATTVAFLIWVFGTWIGLTYVSWYYSPLNPEFQTGGYPWPKEWYYVNDYPRLMLIGAGGVVMGILSVLIPALIIRQSEARRRRES